MNSELSILIADDDPLTRTALSLQLDFLGYPVDYAKDGHEVVTTLAKKKYHLLIIDMHMGATNGLSTTQAIRENLPPEMQPYIVILTGGVTKVELDALQDAGIDEYIEKPVSIYNLQQLVDRCSSDGALSTEPKVEVRNYPTGSHPGCIDFQILQELLNLDRQNEGRHGSAVVERSCRGARDTSDEFRLEFPRVDAGIPSAALPPH